MRKHLVLAAALLALPATGLAKAADDSGSVRPAGVGGVIRSTDALRADDDAAALATVARVDAYQEEAGKVGQILATDLRIKRLGLDMQGDHDRVSDAVGTALRRSDIALDADPVLADEPQARLAELYRAPPEAFDDMFLATQIAAGRDAIQQLEAARSPGLGPAVNQALDIAEGVVQRRLGQAERLRGG